MFGQPCSVDAGTSHWPTTSEPKSTSLASNHTVDFARCFLRLANLPNFALDRLARYEATLWRQAGQILFALDALDRRKPQKPGRRFHIANRQDLQADGRRVLTFGCVFESIKFARAIPALVSITANINLSESALVTDSNQFQVIL